MKKRKNFAVLVVRSLLLLSEVAKDSFEKTGFACVPPGVVVIIKNHFSTVTGTRLPTMHMHAAPSQHHPALGFVSLLHVVSNHCRHN